MFFLGHRHSFLVTFTRELVMKKFAMVLFILVSPALVYAKRSTYIENASDAQVLCREKSGQKLKRKKVEVYNWTADTYRQLNSYITEGEWQSRLGSYNVNCSIEYGQTRSKMKMEINP